MIARLNDRWRVVDDPLQWMLQYRGGKTSDRGGSPNIRAWQGKRFCRTRDALIRDIREIVIGDVDQAALRVIASLPDRHA